MRFYDKSISLFVTFGKEGRGSNSHDVDLHSKSQFWYDYTKKWIAKCTMQHYWAHCASAGEDLWSFQWKSKEHRSQMHCSLWKAGLNFSRLYLSKVRCSSRSNVNISLTYRIWTNSSLGQDFPDSWFSRDRVWVWQRFTAFFNLWDLWPQAGLRECHLLDMRRKYLGRPAISCSQFAASPPRTESCLFSLGGIIYTVLYALHILHTEREPFERKVNQFLTVDISTFSTFIVSLLAGVKRCIETSGDSTMLVIRERCWLAQIGDSWLTSVWSFFHRLFQTKGNIVNLVKSYLLIWIL